MSICSLHQIQEIDAVPTGEIHFPKVQFTNSKDKFCFPLEFQSQIKWIKAPTTTTALTYHFSDNILRASHLIHFGQ